MAARVWTLIEAEAIVADYLAMLSAELRGESLNKTEHRRALQPLLEGRSEGSIERKHMNISAVMIELGYPYIDGYKPYANFQRSLLPEVVSRQIEADLEFEALVARDVADVDISEPTLDDILSALVDRPTVAMKPKGVRQKVRDSGIDTTIKVNYLAREARNQALGTAGERFIVDYERARLLSLGAERLADKVEHLAQTRGDGAGFDVLSYEDSGEERLIEVKTTKYGSLTPFYVTRNEVEVSARESDRYHLYRVFDFRSSPRFFTSAGSFRRSCDLDPTLYRARLSS